MLAFLLQTKFGLIFFFALSSERGMAYVMAQVERIEKGMVLFLLSLRNLIYQNTADRLISRIPVVWSTYLQLDGIFKDHIIDVLLMKMRTEMLLWGINQCSVCDLSLSQGYTVYFTNWY